MVRGTLGVCVAAGGSAGSEEHAFTQHSVEIETPFGFAITNSIVVTWIVATVLIVVARIATRDMKHVSDGAQNFLAGPVGAASKASRLMPCLPGLPSPGDYGLEP